MPAETPADIKPAKKPAAIASPWKKMGGLPTTEQLATIAARLTRERYQMPEDLIKTAMKLWLSAREKIFLTNLMDEIGEQNIDFKDREKSFHVFMQEATTFSSGDEPITRDYFLQKVLPRYKNRADKLAQFAKAFLRDRLRRDREKEPTEDEVSESYGTWRPINDFVLANVMAKKFKKWYAGYVKQARRAAGLKSAQMRKTRKARPPRGKLKEVIKAIDENS